MDSELRPDRVQRSIQLVNNSLIIDWSALELQFLRVSISSFIDNLMLATDTIIQMKQFKLN